MDIEDFMINGKIDMAKIKIYLVKDWLRQGGDLECFWKNFVESINAYIATLNQSTPITPELLERAGFEIYTPGIWLKTVEGVSVIFNERVFLEDARSLIKLPHIVTMEALSELHRGLSGKPLNWRHDPAAKVKRRLEAMGFKSNAGNNYFLSLDGFRFVVTVNLDCIIVCLNSEQINGIETIDQLEKLVGAWKGE